MEKVASTGMGTTNGSTRPAIIAGSRRSSRRDFPCASVRVKTTAFGYCLFPLASIIPRFTTRSFCPTLRNSTLNFGALGGRHTLGLIEIDGHLQSADCLAPSFHALLQRGREAT